MLKRFCFSVLTLLVMATCLNAQAPMPIRPLPIGGAYPNNYWHYWYCPWDWNWPYDYYGYNWDYGGLFRSPHKEPGTASITIQLPEKARLWIDDKEVEQSKRQYTAKLDANEVRTIEIKVSWDDVTRYITVILQPGDQKSVLFMGS